MTTPGQRMRNRVGRGEILPLIGVFDAFSASLAGRHAEGIFLSGFGLAASHYGLPDIGFVAWPHVLDLAARVRAVAPQAHMVVDIDDGYADDQVAIHVARQLERAGASGVILEDQARPRRCGHLGGKNLLPIDTYLTRLEGVLDVCRDLFVIARTDASDPGEIRERVSAFSATTVDAVLVDGQSSVESIQRLRALTEKPLAFNQILGGKSPSFALSELERAGALLAIFSTPLLFAAQAAMETCLEELRRNEMRLDAVTTTVRLPECQAVLEDNWKTARNTSGIPDFKREDESARKETIVLGEAEDAETPSFSRLPR
ncbi:MAG: isocitrate lyase/PEP mutase family protein [Planctomycetota bacterium]